MMEVYKKNFESAGSQILIPKGLSLDLWAESIEDGRKGDFLMLYGLNLLLDTQTMVHLNRGKIWMKIKNPPPDLDTLLNMCNFHLVHLGWGLFIEHVKWHRPLQVVAKSEDVKGIAVGDLTIGESETLDKVIFRGLGIGVDQSEGVPGHSRYRELVDPKNWQKSK